MRKARYTLTKDIMKAVCIKVIDEMCKTTHITKKKLVYRCPNGDYVVADFFMDIYGAETAVFHSTIEGKIVVNKPLAVVHGEDYTGAMAAAGYEAQPRGR